MRFRLVILDGQEGILAHVNSASPLRLGRYGVILDALESIGITAVAQARSAKCLIVIDEIGAMEVYSELVQKHGHGYSHWFAASFGDNHPEISSLARYAETV